MKIIISLFILSAMLFANIGSVTLLRGEATIKRGGSVLDVKLGNDVNSGDKIDTYAKSKMQIILKDDTIITLGSNTEYIFDSYNNKSDPHAHMTLRRGFLKTISGKIGKIAPSRFNLKTKSATIGIRGTGWKTYIGANVENIVCFNGAIIIKTQEKSFELPEGNMLLITDGIAKMFKTDMKFYNAQIKKIEAKQKPKEKEKATPSDKESQDARDKDSSLDNKPDEKLQNDDSDDSKRVESNEQSEDEREVVDNTPKERRYNVENIPPESEIDNMGEGEKSGQTPESEFVEEINTPQAEDSVVEITQGADIESVSQAVSGAVNQDIASGAKPAFEIRPIVETPQLHDPSVGP